MSEQHGCHYFAIALITLLLLAPIRLLAQDSGNHYISISYQNNSLKEILNDISQQSGYLFVYNPEQVNDNVKLGIKARHKDINTIMTHISEILGFTFITIEKQIILKPRKQEISTKTEESYKNLAVSGYIRDFKTHEALIGATISVDGKNIGAVTNGYGYYSLPLKRGDYTLIFSYLGYKREFVKLKLEGNIQIDKMLEYTESALEAISIRADNTQTSAKEALNTSNSNIQIKDFSKYSGLILSGDLVGILATGNGITRLSDGSAFYSVRGGGKDQNLVLIDEAPIYHPSHLFGFYSSVSSDAINAIDVYTSDFPIKYGGRLSSITDIRTKDGSLGKLHFNGELTPFTISGLLETPINKDKITSTLNYRKSILGTLQNYLGRDGSNSFYDVNAKIHAKLSNNDRLYVSFYSSNDYYTDLGTGSNYAVTWNNIAATIRDYHAITQKLFMNNSVYMGRYKYKIFTNDEHTNFWRTSILNFSAKSDMVYNINSSNTIRFGSDYTFHLFTPARLYVDKKKNNSGLLTGNADNIVVYAGAESKLSKKFAIKYGVRVNFWDNYGAAKNFYYNEQTMTWDTLTYNKGRFNTFVRLEPRAALVCLPKENITMKISAERNVQFLHTLSNSISPFTTLDLWVPSGNYFKPQTINALVFSSNIKLRDIAFTFCSYYKYYDNLTEYKLHANMLLNQALESEFYLGQSTAHGFEVAIEKYTGKLHTKAFYAYSRSRRLTPQLYSGQYISDDNIPHTIHLMAGYSVNKHLTIKADWNYNTGIPYTKPVGFYYYSDYKIPYYGERNNARLPDYHKMNIALEYKFSKPKFKTFEHSLTLSVLNAYNRTNFVMVSYNKVKTDGGEYVIPSNYLKDNQFLATGLSLPGIIPMFSWKINL